MVGVFVLQLATAMFGRDKCMRSQSTEVHARSRMQVKEYGLNICILGD
jgi:hypothetical protein